MPTNGARRAMDDDTWARETVPGLWTFGRKPERLLAEADRHPLGSTARKGLVREAWAASLDYARQRADLLRSRRRP